MFNATLNVNKVFSKQVEILLKATFHPSTMSSIRNVMKNNTCIIELVMFYESKKTNKNKCLEC